MRRFGEIKTQEILEKIEKYFIVVIEKQNG
jgi:hypothetical protein